MRLATRTTRFLLGLVILAAALSTSNAQNPAFQAFFQSVCEGNPTGPLSTACTFADNPSTFPGDLSSDSEESLNPSQFLAINQAALARTRAAAGDARSFLEEQRARDADGGGAAGGSGGSAFLRPDPGAVAHRGGMRFDFGSASMSHSEGAASGGGGGSAKSWSLLVHGRYEGLERDQTALERGYDGDLVGLQLGFDVRLSSRGFVGGLLSIDTTDADFDPFQPQGVFDAPTTDGSIETDGYALTLFGSRYLSDILWIDGLVGYGATDYEFLRNATFQESTRSPMIPQIPVSAFGDTDGTELTAGIGVGVDWYRGAWQGSAYARINYADTTVDAYTEQDTSGLQMQVSEGDQDSLVSTVGFRGGHASSTSWGVVVVQGRVEYDHEFSRDAQSFTTRYVLDSQQNPFMLTGDEPDEDTFNAGLGLVFVLPRGWMPFLDAEVLAGHDYLDRTRVTIGLRKEL